MLTWMIGLMALTLNNAPQTDPVRDLTEVPEDLDTEKCICPARREYPDVTFTGYVIDAEMRLGSDKRSVEERMATIFDVKESNNSDVMGRTRLWHNVSDDQCGVSFDYGRKYDIAARWSDDGDLETDRCLMGE